MSAGLSAWQAIRPASRRIVMWGAADQCRVNRPILQDLGADVAVLVDDTPGRVSPFEDVALVSGWTGLGQWLEAHPDMAGAGFVVAIGNPFGHVRVALHRQLCEAGLVPVSFADRTALVSRTATIGAGFQAMAYAVIHPYADIGAQCLVNTRALVEHDCVLEAGVEIGPGAVLTGRVHVGANTWIGAGATVRPRTKIGANVIVGAGAVVTSDIPPGVTVVGVPARPLAGRVPPSALAALAQSGG